MATYYFSKNQLLLTSSSRTEQWQTIHEIQRLNCYNPSVHLSIRQFWSFPEVQSHGLQRKQIVFQARATIVVRSIHMKHLSILIETARCTSCRNRDASKAASNSNFGIDRHFMGATLALPKTRADSVVSVPFVTSFPRRKIPQ